MNAASLRPRPCFDGRWRRAGLPETVVNLPSDSSAGDRPTEGAARLLREIAKGKEAAFAAFYHRWFDRIMQLAARATGRDESFCLDVVQEVLLKVVRAAPHAQTEGQLETWLRRAVLSAAIDLIRREQRRKSRERRGSARPGAVDARDRLVRDDEVAILRARLDELPPEDRALLTLRLGLARKLSAVGAAMGMPVDVVNGRVRRAAARVRKTAEEKEVEREHR